MSADSIHVFDVRGVYVFRAASDERLPRRIESHYNPRLDRYELPRRDLVDELAAVIDLVLVDSSERFMVTFPADAVPDRVRERALLVEDEGLATTVLLPTPEAVREAIESGGEPVAE